MEYRSNDSGASRSHKWLSIFTFFIIILLIIILFCIYRKLNEVKETSLSSEETQAQLAKLLEFDGSLSEISVGAVSFESLSPELKETLENLQSNITDLEETPSEAGPTGTDGSMGPAGATGADGGPGIATAQNGTWLSGSTLEFGTNPLIHDTTLPQDGNDLLFDATGAGGNLIATGEYGFGKDLSISGAGTRAFWYPKKGALRAGQITGTGPLAGAEWDDANIGDFSLSTGVDNVASGPLSTAGGLGNTASGIGAVAFGSSNTVTGGLGIALGNSNTVSGGNSAAFGFSNTSSGFISGTWGIFNESTSISSFAIGETNVASGPYSIALGVQGLASNDHSVAIGTSTVSSGTSSTTLGLRTEASGDWSMAYGIDTTASGVKSTAFGDATLASGFNSTAFGDGATASGSNSTAFGFDTTASGLKSTAFGNSTTASSNQAIAFGDGTLASGFNSTAFGYLTTASGLYSTSFGNGTTAAGDYSLAFGRNFTVDATADESVGVGLDATGYTLSQANTLSIMGGRVGIGTVTPGNAFDVVNTTDDTPASFTGTSGTCTVDTLGGGWSCVSDENLKTNVLEIDGSLDKVLALKGVTYNWKSDAEGQAVSGFIAQDVEAVLPNLVSALDDGTKTLNKDGLMPYIIEAIKEQNGNINDTNTQLSNQGIRLDHLSEDLKALTTRVDGHEQRIVELTERINQLEQSSAPRTESKETVLNKVWDWLF